MVKPKEKKELLKYEDLDIETIGMIEASVLLESLEMKKLRWSAKICVFEILPKTYHSYKVKLVFDDKTYIERIDQLIEEFETSLFANDRASKKVHDRKIAGMRADLDKEIAERVTEHLNKKKNLVS